jgi:hypothetical protein
VYDKTGSQKTTYVAFLTQIHNRSQGIANPHRLDSSIPKAEALLYEKSDCVIILDDLFPVKFHDTKNQQEKTFLEITRIIADGVSRGRKGNKISGKPLGCGVVFTGEYLIGTGSDAARLLPIRLATIIDDVKLRECQDKPLAVSTFFHFFIKWYIDNYYEILSLLKNWWNMYITIDIGVHKRLRETHFFLNTAYKLFLRYCLEKGFTSPNEEQRHYSSFRNLLTNLIKEQDNRVRQGNYNESDAVDYLELVRTLHNGRAFYLAKSGKQFDSEPEKYDGLIHDGLLCLRGEKLLEKIRRTAPYATLNDVKFALRSGGALWLDGEGKNKKVNQRRFIGIRLKNLK